MKTLIEQRPERLPMSIACRALGLNRSSVYAWRNRARHDAPPKRARKDAAHTQSKSTWIVKSVAPKTRNIFNAQLFAAFGWK